MKFYVVKVGGLYVRLYTGVGVLTQQLGQAANLTLAQAKKIAKKFKPHPKGVAIWCVTMTEVEIK